MPRKLKPLKDRNRNIVCFRISDQEREKLERLSVSTDVNLTELMKKAFRSYLSTHEPSRQPHQ